jgi:hypothetical protein
VIATLMAATLVAATLVAATLVAATLVAAALVDAGEDVVTIVDELVGVTGTRGETVVAVAGRAP